MPISLVLLLNGLGIQDLTPLQQGFLNAHPDIVVEKKSDSQMKINLLQTPKPYSLF